MYLMIREDKKTKVKVSKVELAFLFPNLLYNFIIGNMDRAFGLQQQSCTLFLLFDNDKKNSYLMIRKDKKKNIGKSFQSRISFFPVPKHELQRPFLSPRAEMTSNQKFTQFSPGFSGRKAEVKMHRPLRTVEVLICVRLWSFCLFCSLNANFLTIFP